MIPAFFNSDFASESERILTQHGSALPLLASDDSADFLYYTHDLSRKLMFLTRSSWSVCNIHPETWMQKELQPIFTDNPCNEILLTPDSQLDPARNQSLTVELWDDNGERVKIDVTRRLLFLSEQPIGVVGVARRTHQPAAENIHHEFDQETSRRLIETLTKRERDVIELVIRGELNKSIAKKLDIAIRTVEARRSKAMSKLQVQRVTDLVRIWMAGEARSN